MKRSLLSTVFTFKTALRIIIFFCLLLLSWLSQEVWHKESFQLDTIVLLHLHQLANPLLDRVMLSITSLGNPEFVVIVIVGSAGWLLWRRQFDEIKILGAACLGALVLNQGMKLIFARPRPVLWPSLLHETSYGFPSGHALGSMVLYGLLAYFWAVRRPQSAQRIYLGATLLIGLIGLSRLYLGVHFPTDIIAGYGMGWLWLIACIGLLNFQKNRKTTHLADGR
jgi:undecaprenyl-diphosphatase